MNPTPSRAARAALALALLTYLAPLLSAQTPAFADSGFVLEKVASLPPNEPVGLTWGPDGAMYVWQEDGVVRVLKDGILLPDPFIDLRGKVNTVNDRGFLGFALDPDFAANGYAYLLYTYEEKGTPNDAGPKNSRLTRVTADPGNRHVAVPGSEVILLGKVAKTPCYDSPSGTDCIGSESHSHSVGTLRFGKDGKLLVSIGDGSGYDGVDSNAFRSQDLNRYEGKILRVNKSDGSAPGDNPFDDGTNSIRSKVYSYGLRNPYRFAIDPVSGELFIGDVGWNRREEVNTGKGKNFGWPCFEGKDPQTEYQARFASCREIAPASITFGVYTYGGPDGHASIGGAFTAGEIYPAKYRDNYFFADYSNNIIRRMTFGTGREMTAVSAFLTKAEGPVSIELGPDGYLYYISLPTGEVRRIAPFSGTPVAKASATPKSGSSPLEVSFSSAGSSDPSALALTYAWDFGDGDTSSAPDPTHTYATVSTRTFKVKLTVTNTEAKSATDTLSVTVGSTPPRAVILAPAPGTKVLPGDTLRYLGSASDSDETLAPASMSWAVVLRHNEHEHPFGTSTGAGGFVVADAHGVGEYAYELILTVTDRSGLQDTQRVLVTMAPPANKPPLVLAGDSQSVAIEAGAILQGGVSDDGLPVPPGKLTVAWDQKSGPVGGEAAFASPDSVRTKVAFSLPGEYVLRLTASDGELQSASEVRIRVAPAVPTPGMNAAALLQLDFDPADEAADSLATVRVGDDFWVALRIADAKALGSFTVQLAYDTVGLVFLKSVPYDSGSGWINMLSSKGGGLQGGIEVPSTANGFNLTLSGSLAPSDSLKCPSGSGVLGWIHFRVRSPGRYGMRIVKAALEDRYRNGNILDADRLREGAVTAEAATATYPLAAARIALARDEPFLLTLKDTRGRTVYRAEGRGDGLALKLKEAGTRLRPGDVLILRIEARSLRSPWTRIFGPDMH